MRSCSSSCPVVSTVGVSSRRAMRSRSSACSPVSSAGRISSRTLLELLARLVDLALGLLGAVAAGLRLAAGLLERGGKVGGGLLEVLDALQRGEQARDDGGGVVEVGDRVALDAGIGIEQLLGLEVGGGAARLAGGELVVDPRRGLERAEGDERAGRAPAVPRLRLGLERLAQRAHHDRVLLAHAHEHQVARQLEGEVLEEEREVEALVELDRDEDHLERERALVGRVDRADVLLRARARGLAALEEAPPRLGVGGRVVDERVEQPLAQHLGGVEPEQQLGRLAPLRDRALAVRQDEEPVDELREEASSGSSEPVVSSTSGFCGLVSAGWGSCEGPRASHSSRSTAAARESSAITPPDRRASFVVKRSS